MLAEVLEGAPRLLVLGQQRQLVDGHAILAAHLDGRLPGLTLARLGRGQLLGVQVEAFQRQQLVEERLVGLAERLEVGPAPGDVGAGVEDDRALVEEARWCVLLDDAHDPAHELHEGERSEKTLNTAATARKGWSNPSPSLRTWTMTSTSWPARRRSTRSLAAPSSRLWT